MYKFIHQRTNRKKVLLGIKNIIYNLICRKISVFVQAMFSNSELVGVANMNQQVSDASPPKAAVFQYKILIRNGLAIGQQSFP
jgi:hypothetical protein